MYNITYTNYVYSGRTVSDVQSRRDIVFKWNVSYIGKVLKLLLTTILDEEQVNFDKFLSFSMRFGILYGITLEATYRGTAIYTPMNSTFQKKIYLEKEYF